MHKYMKRTAAALLAGIFILGQACTAFAAQDDSNYGPAFGTTCTGFTWQRTGPWR